MKSIAVIALFWICFSLTAQIRLGTDSISTQWLPAEHLIATRAGDATAHKISIARIIRPNRNNRQVDEYIASMGGLLPIAYAKYGRHKFMFSIASTLYTQIVRPPGNIEVETTDFFADVYLDYRPSDRIAFRVGAGHTSQHLTDDAFEIMGFNRSINYVRDYYHGYIHYTIPAVGLDLYGGAVWNHHLIIDSILNPRMLWQWGGEFAPITIRKVHAPFLAWDGKFRGELNGGQSFQISIGWRTGKPLSRHMRFSWFYRTGYEERGQFYNQIRNMHGVNAGFHF
jgi:hypothetical protein